MPCFRGHGQPSSGLPVGPVPWVVEDASTKPPRQGGSLVVWSPATCRQVFSSLLPMDRHRCVRRIVAPRCVSDDDDHHHPSASSCASTTFGSQPTCLVVGAVGWLHHDDNGALGALALAVPPLEIWPVGLAAAPGMPPVLPATSFSNKIEMAISPFVPLPPVQWWESRQLFRPAAAHDSPADGYDEPADGAFRHWGGIYLGGR